MSNLVRKDSLNPTGTEEWKRALDWLLEIGIIPSNNPLAAPDCDVIKFAQAISDGVILCELVNLLRPNTIETITYNTCLNNACLSNVSAFLEALSDYFDISEDVAFDPHDLVGFENFGYFLRTIAQLSHHKLAITRGAKPFDVDQNPRISGYDSDGEVPEDIYTNLQQCVGFRNHSFIELENDKTSWKQTDIYQNQETMSDEPCPRQRYASATCSINSLNSLPTSFPDSNISQDSSSTTTLSQADSGYGSRSHMEPVDYEPIYAYVEEDPYGEESLYQAVVEIRRKQSDIPSPTVSKIHYILSELCETEGNYLNTLEIINKNFRASLELSLPKETIKTIFINVQQLYSFHKKLLDSLNGLLSQKKYEVSQSFSIYMDKFVLYCEYASKVPEAIAKVKELNGNPKISKVLENCQESTKQRFPLKDLLTMPIQRVLKYPLLIRELIKNSSEEESKLLENTLVSLEDIAKHINTSKNDYEKRKFVTEIFESVENLPPVKLNVGQLVLDGEMKVKVGSNGSDPKAVAEKRAVFLFPRAILVCEKKKRTTGKTNFKYTFREFIHLEEYHTEALYSNMPRMKSEEQYQSGFMAIPNNPLNSRGTILFYCRTPLLANNWNVALVNAQLFISPKEGSEKNHTFEVRTWNQTTRCTICDKILWGLFDQGYHCQVCQESCHRSCISRANFCTRGCRAHTHDGSLSTSQGHSKPTVMKRNPAKNSYGEGGTCKPTYTAWCDYNADPHPGGSAPILLFKKGDEISIVSANDRDWWEGKNNRTGQMGLFPSRAVKIKSNAGGSYMDVMIGQFQPPNRDQDSYNESMDDPLVSFRKGVADSLTEQPWYLGKMSRHEAEQILDKCENGVFLMRESDQRPGEYALAIRYEDAPKHIKISYNPRSKVFFMVEAQPFKSLIPLVEYYSVNSLNVCFQGINTKLLTPYWSYAPSPQQQIPPTPYMPQFTMQQPLPPFPVQSRPTHKLSSNAPPRPPPPPRHHVRMRQSIAYCQALYNYEPTGPSELALVTGQNIKLMNKETEHAGWWLGEVEGRIGLFPANYVRLNEFIV